MLLRAYLAIAWLSLAGFTLWVISRDGLGLFGVFFGDIARGHWPGQFNADFLSLLVLSALWTGWRNGWGLRGTALAAAALFLGGGFLMAYLVVLLGQTRGDIRRVLLGVRA